MKKVISIYYTDSDCTPVILQDGSKEYVNKKQLNFYGLKSEIESKAESLMNNDSSVKISHVWIY